MIQQPRNEKNHALEKKVEIAQNKNPLVFSEVMAFARIFTHFTQNVWIFFKMLELNFQDMDKGSKMF